jgi:hypothetical protein
MLSVRKNRVKGYDNINVFVFFFGKFVKKVPKQHFNVFKRESLKMKARANPCLRGH